jgi:nucleoside-diphosphate-sugar epimerase
MSRILVTGATGLLGARVVELGSARGHEMIAVGRAAPRAAQPNVRPITMDLARPLDRSALPERVDAVFHLAQSRRFRDFPDGAEDMFAVNVARTAELLDYACSAGASHFVLASTGGVYAPSAQPLIEASPLAERPGYYPASKLAAELLAHPYAGLMTVAILRFFFIYGPGQQHDMLMPRLVASVREERAIRLQGMDGLSFNPIHVADAAAATLAALSLEDSATINVAGPVDITLREVGEIIGARLCKQPHFEVEDETSRPLVADTALMRGLLVEPTVTPQAGIGDVL